MRDTNEQIEFAVRLLYGVANTIRLFCPDVSPDVQRDILDKSNLEISSAADDDIQPSNTPGSQERD
jgi:hypothetical protein